MVHPPTPPGGHAAACAPTTGMVHPPAPPGRARGSVPLRREWSTHPHTPPAGRRGSLRTTSDRPTPPGRCGNRPLHADGGCWRSARGAVRSRLRERHAIAPTNTPSPTHTPWAGTRQRAPTTEWSTHPHRPAGTRQRAPTTGMVHAPTPPGGHAAACPYDGNGPRTHTARRARGSVRPYDGNGPRPTPPGWQAAAWPLVC
jgi:hypothetical protein